MKKHEILNKVLDDDKFKGLASSLSDEDRVAAEQLISSFVGAFDPVFECLRSIADDPVKRAELIEEIRRGSTSGKSST